MNLPRLYQNLPSKVAAFIRPQGQRAVTQGAGSVLTVILLALAIAGCKPRSAPENQVGQAPNAAPGTYFVATNGNDAWSGTLPNPGPAGNDGPFATPGRAIKAARDWKGQHNSAATVVLRQGCYFLPETLVLTPEDSGLTLAAYAKEQPVLSGGRPITGWKETEVNGKKGWVAEVPGLDKWDFRELWVGGRRATRARHPDQGYLAIAELVDKSETWTQGQGRFRFKAGDLVSSAGITNGELVAMSRWVESRLPIAAVDEKDHVVSFGKRSVFELAAGDPYYVEGVMDYLDVPGEWCLDRASGRIYYLPRPGEKMGEVEAVAPALVQVLRLEGHPERAEYVQNVVLKGLGFAHTEWYFVPGTEAGGFPQAAVGVPGAVLGNGVKNCTVERCRFFNLGNYGLELARGCQSNRILNCEFSTLGAGGIKLGETDLRSAPDDQTGGNEISDCTLHDGGRMFHSAIGIWLGQSSDNRITHNLIHDFYYTGISIGWTWGYGPARATNNLVAFNHVHHIGLQSDGDGPILSDMGGIYTLSMQPGTRVVNNLWHDIAGLRYGGWGIYLDEGSSSIVVASNIVYRTTHGGFHQHYGATNTVCNNIFAFARDHQVQRSRPESHISFSFLTNIVYFDHGVALGSSWADDKFIIDWNVYWDARPEAKPADMLFAGETLEKWRARGHDVHSMVSDPLFLDPKRDDFGLRPGSPALKLGFQPIDLRGVGPRSAKE